mgnify:CR=1 FL=1
MDKAVVIAFGKVIQRKRKILKMTQEELAFRASLDRTCVSYVENARKVPSIVSIFAFANGLNVSASYLISEVEKELKR